MLTPQRLKSGRAKAGLTQRQAARLLGISHGYLAQLELNADRTRRLPQELVAKFIRLYRL